MAKIIQDIKLEVAKPNRFQAIIAKQYDDDSRFLKVTFVNDGEKIEIHQTSKAVINANRIDGVSKSYQGVSNGDGTATVPINSWMLELEGNLYCDVTIIDSEGRKLTSTSFTVLVEKSASGDISANPDADILVSLIEQFDSKANIYEYNDEVRCTGVESIHFVVSEEAEKSGVTIVNNNNEYQYIDYINVDGGEYWLSQALNYGEPLHFRLTEENAENTYDLWKAGAECVIYFSGAYAVENLDVSVLIPNKVDVKDCYEKAKEVERLQKKFDYFGFGKTVVEAEVDAGDGSVHATSPYGRNTKITLQILNGQLGIPNYFEVDGYRFTIRSDCYDCVAGCSPQYINLNENVLLYIDGDSEYTLENLYEGDFSLADILDWHGDDPLDVIFYFEDSSTQDPFKIVFELDEDTLYGSESASISFEEWEFTLENGSTVTKRMVVGG